MLVLVHQHPVYLLLPFVEVSLGELHHPSSQIVLLLLAMIVIVHFLPFSVPRIISAYVTYILGASCPCSSIIGGTSCCVTKAQTMTLYPDWLNISPHTWQITLYSSSPSLVGGDPSNWSVASTNVCSH